MNPNEPQTPQAPANSIPNAVAPPPAATPVSPLQPIEPMQPAPIQPVLPSQPTMPASSAPASAGNKKLLLIIALVVGLLLIAVAVFMVTKKDTKKTPLTSSTSDTSLNTDTVKTPTVSEPAATVLTAEQKEARDSERAKDSNAIIGKLEQYYNEYAGYPTPKDLANANWVKTNMPELSIESLKDPNGKLLGTTGADYVYNNEALGLTAKPNCVSPTKTDGTQNASNNCEHYSITIKSDARNIPVRYSLN